MSMKKKELLEYFDEMCLFLANHHWTERDERAVAIREMIQKSGKIPQKRALTVDEIISKYPESVRILLRELLLKIENLQKKPEVTVEFVKKWGNKLWSKYRISLGNKDFVRGLLKEAGVEVKEKK